MSDNPELPKLAYLTSCYPAPSHTFIRREVHAVRARGLEVHTFSVRAPSPENLTSPEDQDAYRTTFYLLPLRPWLYLRSHAALFAAAPAKYFRTFGHALSHRTPGLKSLIWSVAYFLEAMVLAYELQKRGITHVHNHFANPSATVSLLATRYLSGVKYSLTLHGHSETDYPAGVLLGRKLDVADFAACVSNYGRAQACRTVQPEHWGKFEIVRCALNLGTLPVPPRRDPSKPFRFICVARLDPEKGHHGLLEAYAQYLRRNPSAPASEMVFVGGGNGRKQIEAAILKLGLTDHVTLLGALPESRTLEEISKSDALVLASFMEGLPVVLMEAMAMRKPVIAPHLAGIPDMIKHGENGLLFNPSDWTDLRCQIERLMYDSALRRKLSINGRTTIEREYQIGIAVQPLIARFLMVHTSRVLESTTVVQPESFGRSVLLAMVWGPILGLISALLF